MLGRIMRSADFELALSSPAKARSAHFAAHHVPVAPLRSRWRKCKTPADELSTDRPVPCTQAVDDPDRQAPDACWFGAVVPKRHARRAATRNLLKRQIRAAMLRHEPRLARGLWLVRVRAPFERARYHAATSPALCAAARDELEQLLGRAGD